MNLDKEKIFYNLKTKAFVVLFLIILIFALVNSASAIEENDAMISETDSLSGISVHNFNSNLENDDKQSIVHSNDNEQLLTVHSDDETIQHSVDSEEDEQFLIAVHSQENDDSLQGIVPANTANDDIQGIFDNANNGDTIEFNEKTYNGISIVVDKKLNIVSYSNSNIISSNALSNKAKSMGIQKTFAFYFTKLASGSVIKGLTLTGDADYMIFVEEGCDIKILDNTLAGGKSAGIYLNNSKDIVVQNNIIKNSFDGIYLNNVNNININSNQVFSNKNTGLVLKNLANSQITYNKIFKNGLDGILLQDSSSNNILSNDIIENGVSGIRLEGITSYNVIKHNNISANSINVFANSNTSHDEITRNTLMYAKASFNAYVAYDNTGSGIYFGDSYSTTKKGQMLFSHNSIGFNELWDAKTDMSNLRVDIGPNWYFDNDGNYAKGHICPMIFGSALSAANFKYLSMGFSADGDGVFGQLYDGQKATGAGEFTVDNVNIDGVDYGSVKVDSNGRLKLDLKKLKAGSKVTVTINGHSFTVTVDEDLEATVQSTNDGSDSKATNQQQNEKPNEKENYESDVPLGKGKSSIITGNGTGSGSGSHSGIGSGEGNFTGSGISVGTVSGESNSGTGDSGENGGGSAGIGAAYEILQEENTPTTAKNSQLFAVAGVALVILIIALGYRSKNKDDYQSDNNNYDL